MKIEINHNCADFNSYRAARVKSLFNAENGCNWQHIADLPIENNDWKIGLIVGPSGSGKTSIGNKLFDNGIYDLYAGWAKDKPIIDCAEQPEHAVIDEFTSVIDRQIAKIGAQTFSKAWKRGTGQIVLLSCHYDIIEWLQPDWVYDTSEARFARDCLRQRPKIEVQIYQVKGSVFRHFKPHYYLDLPYPVAAEYFVGIVDNEPVCFLAVAPLFMAKAYRATRLVVMPEWQGAGVGTRFLDAIGQYHLEGKGRCGHKFPTFFHTSHPQLCAALRRSQKWVQTGAMLYGANKSRIVKSMQKSRMGLHTYRCCTGYGGHLRAVQSFKFVGAGLAPAQLINN
jgi:GNAT superfamily N-acetyltransferase